MSQLGQRKGGICAVEVQKLCFQEVCTAQAGHSGLSGLPSSCLGHCRNCQSLAVLLSSLLCKHLAVADK